MKNTKKETPLSSHEGPLPYPETLMPSAWTCFPHLASLDASSVLEQHRHAGFGALPWASHHAHTASLGGRDLRCDLPRSRGWHPSLPAPPPNTHPRPTQSIRTISSVNKGIIPSHFWLPAPSRQPAPCVYKPCLTIFIFPPDTAVGVQLIRILSRFPCHPVLQEQVQNESQISLH